MKRLVVAACESFLLGAAPTLELPLGGDRISLSVNTAIVFTAGTVAAFLTGRPLWARLQRWVMGTVLAGLALRLALDSGRR